MSAQRFSRTGRFRLISAVLNRPGALIVDDDGVRIEPLFGGERAVECWAWADIRRAGLEEIVAEDVAPEVQLVLVRQDGEARRIKLADYGRPEDIAAALRRHIDLDPQPWQTLGREQQIGNGLGYVAGAILLFSIVAPLAAAFLRFDEDGRWRSFMVLLVVAALLLVMGSFFRRARPPVVETEGMRFWQPGTIRVARWHTLAWEDILDIEPERWGGCLPMVSISGRDRRRFRVSAASLGWPTELPARLRDSLPPDAFAVPAHGRGSTCAEIVARHDGLHALGMALVAGSSWLSIWMLPAGWHVLAGSRLMPLAVLVSLGCVFAVWWLGREGVRRRPFSSLFAALLLGLGLAALALKVADPLLLEAGWHRAEAVEMRFVAVENDRQVWTLNGRKVQIDSNWSGFAAPPEGSRWRLMAWRGPFGTQVIPPGAFGAAERMEETR